MVLLKRNDNNMLGFGKVKILIGCGICDRNCHLGKISLIRASQLGSVSFDGLSPVPEFKVLVPTRTKALAKKTIKTNRTTAKQTYATYLYYICQQSALQNKYTVQGVAS